MQKLLEAPLYNKYDGKKLFSPVLADWLHYDYYDNDLNLVLCKKTKQARCIVVQIIQAMLFIIVLF